MLLLVLGVVGVASAVTVLVVRRPPSPPTASEPPAQDEQPQQSQPQEQQPQQSQPRPPATSGRQVPKDKGPLEQLGEAGLVGAAGAALGFLASVGAQDTKEAKQAAPLIGAGAALAAYMANVGGAFAGGGLTGTLAGLSVIAAPVLVATFAVTVVVDQILRAVKQGQWAEMARQVRALRKAGRYRDALALYQQTAPSIGENSRVWPRQDEDWYGWDDPQQVGRPYPGFPGPPAPASAAEVRARPDTVPETLATDSGQELDIQRLLDAAYLDAETARAAVLASPVPGKVVRAGRAGGLTDTTEGLRDVRAQEPYKSARALADDWARKLAAGVPWIESTALVRDMRDVAEKAVDAESARLRGIGTAAALADFKSGLAGKEAAGGSSATRAALASVGLKGVIPPPPAPTIAQVRRQAGEETTATQHAAGSAGARGATNDELPAGGRGSQTNQTAARNRPGGDI